MEDRTTLEQSTANAACLLSEEPGYTAMIFVTASAAAPASSPAGAPGRTGTSEVIDCFRPRAADCEFLPELVYNDSSFFVAILVSVFSLANIKHEMLALALAFVLAILCTVGLLMLHGAVRPSEAIDTVVRFIPDALLGIAVVWLLFRWVRKKG
jgi:hypothetical protein